MYLLLPAMSAASTFAENFKITVATVNNGPMIEMQKFTPELKSQPRN